MLAKMLKNKKGIPFLFLKKYGTYYAYLRLIINLIFMV